MIGEFLYQLTPRDQVSVGIELVHKNITVDSTGPAIEASYTVPVGRVLVCHRLWGEMNPGTLDQIVDSEFFFRGLDGPNNVPIQVMSVATKVAGTNNLQYGYADFAGEQFNLIGKSLHHSWQGELWFEPGAVIGNRCTFNAQSNSHRVVLVLFGLLLPRGNLVV